MRFGLLVWVGDVALAVRTPVAESSRVETVDSDGSVTWWLADAGL